MVENVDGGVSVEAPRRFHKDWDAWWAYKKEYEDTTFQVIRVSETLRIKTRNERARNTKAAKQGMPIVEYPEPPSSARLHLKIHTAIDNLVYALVYARDSVAYASAMTRVGFQSFY
ncbi:hypothetical protein PINS_up023215, partial [Pythium insidiosum]